MTYDVGSGPWCSRLADGVHDAEETEQERTTAEALHEIADMPGEDSYGFYVRVVREGDVCEGQLEWAEGRRNDLLELHFANGCVRLYRDEDVKRQSGRVTTTAGTETVSVRRRPVSRMAGHKIEIPKEVLS